METKIPEDVLLYTNGLSPTTLRHPSLVLEPQEVSMGCYSAPESEDLADQRSEEVNFGCCLRSMRELSRTPKRTYFEGDTAGY